MTTRPEPITELSFENARAELLSRANALRAAAGFGPFLDDSALNPHVMILELLAAYCELTGVTIDNRRLGAMLVTARSLRDAIVAARQIDYDWQGVGPAIVELELDFGAGGHAKAITIPDGFAWHDDPPYLQDGDVDIPAGTQFVTVTARQVERHSFTVYASGASRQEITLPETPVVKGSMSVEVDAVAARLVEYLFELDPSELGLQARVDENEAGVLLTGDGDGGAVLSAGAEIVVQYSTSLGSQGRIAAGTIDASIDTILDEDSAEVVPTITQAETSSGGSDIESIDQMRINGPRSLRTLNANIAAGDFEAHAESVAGVRRAIALTWQDDISIPITTTLVLCAAEPADDDQEQVFSDTHASAVISPGVWQQNVGVWSQSGGEMLSPGPAGEIELIYRDAELPISAGLTMRVQAGTDPIEIVLRDADGLDQLFARITPDGFGDAAVAVGQVVSAAESSTAGTLGLDPATSIQYELRYTLADGLELYADDTLIAAFAAPAESLRTELRLVLLGNVAVTLTTLTQLVGIGIPTTALTEAVRTALTDRTKLFVAHRVEVGSVRFRILSLVCEATPLPGYTQAQAEANSEAAMREALAILTRDEDGEFVNQPGESVFDSTLIAAAKDAAGVRSFRIVWPDQHEFTVGATEFLVLGEVRFE